MNERIGAEQVTVKTASRFDGDIVTLINNWRDKKMKDKS